MAELRWIVLLFLVGVAVGEKGKPFKGDKVIRVIPSNDKEVRAIAALEDNPTYKVSFWKEAHKPGMAADLHVRARYYGAVARYLKANGLEFTIQILDVQKEVEMEELNLGRATGFFSGYQRLEKIEAELRRLAGQRTNAKVTLNTAGRTYEQRQQYYMEIKGKRRVNKPVFFMNCGIHAREWITPATCMYIITQFVNNYGKDAKITSILDKMDFIIMPVLNADGYAYTWSGGRARLWRKTRKPGKPDWWGRRCIGTDPNRNWGYKWGLPGASANPCSDTYRGERAHSEQEVANVAGFLKRLGGRLKGYMDIHAYSQLWMIPYGFTKTPTRDHRELMRVSNAGIAAIQSSGYGTRYRAGPSSVIIYENSGGSKDYTYGSLGVKYSFALELRDTGRHGFLLPPNQIIPTGMETFNGILAMAQEMKV